MEVNQDNVSQIWHDWFMTDAFEVEKRRYSLLRRLPEDPRCKLCHTRFKGVGGAILGSLFGRKQSDLNPTFCNVCESFAKKFPGGAEVEMSMLFADMRGSTVLSEQMTPLEFTKLINRFYVGATHLITEENGYQALHADLKAKYLSQHVAIHEGLLVDHDTDPMALAHRVRQRFGYIPILITQVREQPMHEYRIRSPRVVRSA